jgi:hypothetical protein
MGKITLINLYNELKIQFPKELIFLFKQSEARQFKISLTFNNTTKVLELVVSDIGWDQFATLPWLYDSHHARTRRKRDLVTLGYTTAFIRNSNRYNDCFDELAFCVSKGKGYTICDKIELDYTIYKNDLNQILITSSINLSTLHINYNQCVVFSRMKNLHREIYNITPSITMDRLLTAVKDVDEIYYFQELKENNICYITKDKYAYAIHKNQEGSSLSTGRTMGIGKFFKEHFPYIPESTVNAHIEYNKMLSSYDPNLFSIVSGDDIVKYYLEDSYFRKTGELGSSCMRGESKSHVIEFYAKNPNFRLLIMKAGETDSIMARALLVTTTDGTVFMDRIYTVDTKVISSFHKYAKENGIENIYEHRNSSGKTNLFTMGPGNWTKEYRDNYKVGLVWLPDAIKKLNKSNMYSVSMEQQSSITNSRNVPYIDNFQYINPFTMQASVNKLNFFATCDLSGELIDNTHVYYDNNKVYDQRFINVEFTGPVLKPDVVTLDDEPVIPTSEVVITYNMVTEETLLNHIFTREADLENVRPFLENVEIVGNQEPEESEEDESEDWDEEDDWDESEDELVEEENPHTITAGTGLMEQIVQQIVQQRATRRHNV